MKKKTLIVLSGVTNSGKSATLRLLIKELRNIYPNSNFKILGNKKTINIGDCRVIFEGVGKDSINLGVSTAGDDSYQVGLSMELFDVYDCDIVVCATKAGIASHKGSVTRMQQEIIKRGNDLVVIPIFKLMYKNDDLNKNDEYIKTSILNQLEQIINF